MRWLSILEVVNMAIQAKRFEFLDKETNVGINDFINTEDSDIIFSCHGSTYPGNI